MKAINAIIALAIAPAIAPAADLKFRMQEIDATLKVGYGVVIADVNGDGKPDIVVADANRVVWYENPTWKRRTMIEGAVPPDIVCIAACDIERNGKVAFFIGADWRPFDTTTGGTIHWMRRGKTLDDPWEVFKIGEEPTVHRMKVADFDRSGRSQLLVAPLMGNGATKEGNWADGRPVRLMHFSIPSDPVKGPWAPRYIVNDLHIVHNMWVRQKRGDVWIASLEGFSLLSYFDSKISGPQFDLNHGRGMYHRTATNHRGASEIASGRVGKDAPVIATVEPWHGNEIVSYANDQTKVNYFVRHVLDDKLRWGHALWCSDLDGGGSDWIIAGVRDDLSKNPGERRGVRIYKCTDGKGEKWDRQIVDDGGIACEDLTVADLNGDGRADIIATGRQTGNVRIYWNEGRK